MEVFFSGTNAHSLMFVSFTSSLLIYGKQILSFQLQNIIHYPTIAKNDSKLLGEAATGGIHSEKVFLEISQNLQENACARVSFFNNVAGLRQSNFIESTFQHEFCEISKNTLFIKIRETVPGFEQLKL